MTVNAGYLAHYAIPLFLLLIGFHGIFFYSNLLKKTASWICFQAGLIVFLTQGFPGGSPLSSAVSLEAAFLTFIVTLLLGGLCLKIHRRYKTLVADLIGKRDSK
jgi:hypothetical protein